MLAFRVTAAVRPLFLCRSLTTQTASVESADDRQAARQRRVKWFDDTLTKHRNAVGRIEKIEVRVRNIGPNDDMTLLMNRSLSTPFHCAQHVGQLFVERSVYAKVDNQLWDMNRPLQSDCELTLHHFREEDSTQANRVFWRSCSFLLGKVTLSFCCLIFSLFSLSQD
jgi:hypothetical protein